MKGLYWFQESLKVRYQEVKLEELVVELDPHHQLVNQQDLQRLLQGLEIELLQMRFPREAS
jgi:hypothetical protein